MKETQREDRRENGRVRQRRGICTVVRSIKKLDLRERSGEEDKRSCWGAGEGLLQGLRARVQCRGIRGKKERERERESKKERNGERLK